jgi:hypothetical protein
MSIKARSGEMTFNEARAILFDKFEQIGWKTVRSLKVPWATSPNGQIRVWLKTQALHGNDKGTATCPANGHSCASRRSYRPPSSACGPPKCTSPWILVERRELRSLRSLLPFRMVGRGESGRLLFSGDLHGLWGQAVSWLRPWSRHMPSLPPWTSTRVGLCRVSEGVLRQGLQP